MGNNLFQNSNRLLSVCSGPRASGPNFPQSWALHPALLLPGLEHAGVPTGHKDFREASEVPCQLKIPPIRKSFGESSGDIAPVAFLAAGPPQLPARAQPCLCLWLRPLVAGTSMTGGFTERPVLSWDFHVPVGMRSRTAQSPAPGPQTPQLPNSLCCPLSVLVARFHACPHCG